MSSRILVFYAGMLYGQYSHLDFDLEEIPDGSYIRGKNGWYVMQYTATRIEEQDVPPQVRMLALLLT